MFAAVARNGVIEKNARNVVTRLTIFPSVGSAKGGNRVVPEGEEDRQTDGDGGQS